MLVDELERQVTTGSMVIPAPRLRDRLLGPRELGSAADFLHGGLLDHRQWDAEFRSLIDIVPVIRFDARGHGTSSVPITDFSHHLDLIALLDALGVERVIGVG